MSVEFSENKVITFRTRKCYLCGVHFALEACFDQWRQDYGERFFCPNGHSQAFTKPLVGRLREEIQDKERQLRTTKCELMAERLKCEKTEQSKARILKRIHAGICPKCHRSFINLRRHMESKHKC